MARAGADDAGSRDGALGVAWVTFPPNRYYDPSTDQFLSVDPDVNSTLQPYAFVGGDPVECERPDG